MVKVAPLSDSPAGLNRFPSISSLSSTHSRLSASNRDKRIHTQMETLKTEGGNTLLVMIEIAQVLAMNLTFIHGERKFPTKDFNTVFPKSKYLSSTHWGFISSCQDKQADLQVSFDPGREVIGVTEQQPFPQETVS